MSDFYSNLSVLCSDLGKSVTSVVEACGIAKSNITAWKKGASPRNETAKAIADYLGVPVSSLIPKVNENEQASEHGNIGGLLDEEKMVIDLYRKLKPKDKLMVIGLMERLHEI